MEGITPRFTYADLRELPEDGRRYEVIEGDLCVTPAPKTRHQRVSWKLTLFLGQAEESGFGVGLAAPTDVYLDDHNGVQPDLVIVLKEHADIVVENEVRGVPDLVVEILSASTRARDLGVKLRLYARFGVRVYWVVDPDAQTVTVFRLGGDGCQPTILGRDDTLVCNLFPGIQTPVARIFAVR